MWDINFHHFLTACYLGLFFEVVASNLEMDFKSKSSMERNKCLTRNQELIFEDAFLDTTELIAKYGYPVETHSVKTDDDYFVQLHRISRPGAVPVFFMHGFTESSGSSVMLGPEKGIAYILYDAGYDVWLGNARGSRYSKKHLYLNTNSRTYWDFTFHEIGVYDLPACIDHILGRTGFKKIHYVGYSQGSTAFWIMCALRQRYCNKIRMMNALAPAAYMSNTRSPSFLFAATIADKLDRFTDLTGDKEFQPNNQFFTLAGQLLCRDHAITQELCTNSLFLLAGYDSEQLNATSLPVVFGHVPAGAATKQLVHYAQFVRSGKFQYFDYGKAKNLLKYGSVYPPAYNLTKVTAPVAIHYSENDWVAVPMDVKKLANQLPNLQEMHLVPHKKFNHVDFMYAIDVKSLLYNKLIELMQKIDDSAK